MPRILIIEDERKVLSGLERGLQGHGYEVVGEATGEAGLERALTQPFDCIVLDLLLPGRDGLQVLTFPAAKQAYRLTVEGSVFHLTFPAAKQAYRLQPRVSSATY